MNTAPEVSVSPCRKVPFQTRREAQTRANGATKWKSFKHKPLTPYHCPSCSFWHLTSMTRREAKAVKKASAARGR